MKAVLQKAWGVWVRLWEFGARHAYIPLIAAFLLLFLLYGKGGGSEANPLYGLGPALMRGLRHLF